MKKTILVSACLIMLLSLAVLAASMNKDEKTTTPQKATPTQENKTQQDATKSQQETKSIADTLRGLPEASQFLSMAEKTGTIKELEGKGPMTVLVPVNTAFDSMSTDLRKEIQDNENKKKSCCRYHIIKGDLSLVELKATTEELETFCDEDGCTMDIATILTKSHDLIKKEIACSNGRIYLINSVMIPDCCKKSLLEKATDEARKVYEKTRDAVGEGYEKTRDAVGEGYEKATDAIRNILPHGSESK